MLAVLETEALPQVAIILWFTDILEFFYDGVGGRAPTSARTRRLDSQLLLPLVAHLRGVSLASLILFPA